MEKPGNRMTVNTFGQICIGVAGGVGAAAIGYIAVQGLKQARKLSGLKSVDVRLKLSQDVPSGTHFVLRHVRNGKDDVPGRSDPINKDFRFRHDRTKNEWLARIRYPKNIGFQFKCFAEFPLCLKADVDGVLKASGFTTSRDLEHLNRLWFTLPSTPMYKTVDGFTNNYCYSADEIVHDG